MPIGRVASESVTRCVTFSESHTSNRIWEWTKTTFETERDRLTRIATRILRSETEADDVVQEARLRLANATDVDDLPAWLTTVVTRLCLDHLRKRQTRSAFEASTSVEVAGTVKVAFVFHVEGDLVHEIELIANPEVLANIDVTRLRNHLHKEDQTL
jgi:DNA-directed RNA polymerase specialized sigma24 family protein